MWLTHDATNDAADHAVVPDVLPLDLLRRRHPDRLHRSCLARRLVHLALEIRHLRWRRGVGLAGAGVGNGAADLLRVCSMLGFGETAAAGCGLPGCGALVNWWCSIRRGTERINQKATPSRIRDRADVGVITNITSLHIICRTPSILEKNVVLDSDT